MVNIVDFLADNNQSLHRNNELMYNLVQTFYLNLEKVHLT